LALLVGCVGCDDTVDCTNADCIDGFSIRAVMPGSATTLPQGDYEVELSLDEARVVCQVTLPAAASGLCDAADVELLFLTDRAQDNERTGLWVTTTRTPGAATAIVRHQGTVVAQGSFRPEYVESAPNGSECGPVCENASQVLTLSF
jgi:hypothetical protein